MPKKEEKFNSILKQIEQGKRAEFKLTEKEAKYLRCRIIKNFGSGYCSVIRIAENSFMVIKKKDYKRNT